jgi:ABC-type branched-subunit amino acid transport system substrate-binding protein
MKKHTALFRLLAMLFALTLVAAACGRDDDDGDDAGGPATTAAEGGEEEPTEPQPGPGFDGTTIKLGVVTPQTGPVQIIGNPLTNGNNVYWQYVNEELGGVAGKYQVELVVVDSKYDPNTGVQQYNAIKNDVVMFNQLLGTPIVSALLEQLARDNIVAQPASLDAFWVREANLLPIGAPYQIQFINAASWYLDEGGGEGQTICFAGHDDPYGEAGLEGLQFASEELGFEIAVEARFKATDTDFTAPVQQLQSANCQAVFLTATPTTAGGVMGKAAQSGFAPKWIGQSPTYIGAFLQSPLLPYLQANYLLAAEGTEWGDESVEGMAQMIEHQTAYAPDQAPDIYFTFGYAEAWAVHQLLEKAVELGDLSRDGIVNAMNELEQLEFGELFGTYPYGAPEDRDPPRRSTIFSVDPAAPGGLRAMEKGIESDAAKAYEFPTE